MLNNPKTRELLLGVAGQANQKIRQQIEAFVESEIAKATAPLRARINELEERVAALEGGRQRPAARPHSPSRADIDPGSV
jgi:hypothetical protein